MKHLIYSIIIVAFISCKGNENKTAGGNSDTVKTADTKTEYTCPMHPDVISDKPGKCPRCGMDLEAKS